MHESPRLRRLRSDLRTLEQLQAESSILDFEARGLPPDHYILTFHGRGLWRPEGTNSVELRDEHVVRVQLGSSYPRMMPDLAWQTPLFHPNVSAGGHVCLGGYGTYWVPSVQLDELCHMLWDMIRYANYDIKSPYNREAALWVKGQAIYRFPLDPRPLRNLVQATEQPLADKGKQPVEQREQPSLFPTPAREIRSAATLSSDSQIQLERIAAQALAPAPVLVSLPVVAPADEVTFLGEVVEGEAIVESAASADEGITFLN